MESPNSLLNKVMTLQASIKRKIQQKKTSRTTDNSALFLKTHLIENKTKRIQSFLKSKLLIDKYKLINRIDYYNYISNKIKNITDNECLEENRDSSGGYNVRKIINLERPIGSVGYNGSIYITSIKNTLGTFPIATKLMKDNENNRNEVSLMNHITKNIILNRHSKHFLIMYKSCTCNIDTFPKERKLFAINEIANGDLNVLIDDPKIIKNKRLIFNLLYQCFISVATFHNSINKVHQDIHAGNFLWQKNNEKGYYHYKVDEEDYYLESCGYNIMLYDLSFAKDIRSKKSIFKILADYTEIIPAFLKNEYEDETTNIAPPDDDVIAQFYSIIDILMIEYKDLLLKYNPQASSSPKTKNKIYQKIYFNYVIQNIMIPYAPQNMFLTSKPKNVINDIPFIISI